MLNTFLNFVQSNKLFTSKQKILVAISGGIDSVVLVDLLNRGQFQFALAHCNFNLRGKESDGDEEFVEQLAARLNVPFVRESFDLKEKSEKEGDSIQMAARQVRYEWFEKIRIAFEYDVIATAHHKNDSIETVLFNLTKGTGLAGLHGIKPKVNYLVRPLLFATKDDIIKHAEKYALQWREDSSNTSNKYFRNLIRHEVIPVLKKINPKLEETFQITIDRLTATEDFFISQVAAIKNIILEKRADDYWISIKALNKYAGVEVIMQYILNDFGFNFSQTRQIIQSIDGHSGKVFYTSDFVLNIDRNYIVITAISDEFSGQYIYDISGSVSTPHFNLDFEELQAANLNIDTSADVAYIDYEKVELPFELRPWRKGDKFVPLGMTTNKKLSDFMIDQKIPVNLKSRLFVLTTNNTIFWVVGHRIDNRFKITENSRRILKIVKQPNDDKFI